MGSIPCQIYICFLTVALFPTVVHYLCMLDLMTLYSFHHTSENPGWTSNEYKIDFWSSVKKFCVVDGVMDHIQNLKIFTRIWTRNLLNKKRYPNFFLFTALTQLNCRLLSYLYSSMQTQGHCHLINIYGPMTINRCRCCLLTSLHFSIFSQFHKQSHLWIYEYRVLNKEWPS